MDILHTIHTCTLSVYAYVQHCVDTVSVELCYIIRFVIIIITIIITINYSKKVLSKTFMPSITQQITGSRTANGAYCMPTYSLTLTL